MCRSNNFPATRCQQPFYLLLYLLLFLTCPNDIFVCTFLSSLANGSFCILTCKELTLLLVCTFAVIYS